MGYVESDLVRIARRENNTKRNYLVVNPLQGKHIPVLPSVALQLFTSLADTFRESYKKEKLLLVGFAETATAIGAQVAISLGVNYMQTTREPIANVEYLFFSEEHSHAAEQKLVKNDLDMVADEVDRIIFIEDEVTTGNTILNIVKILDKEYSGKFQYAVASLLNGMTDEHLELYRKKGIDLHYLVKTEHSSYAEKAEMFAGNGSYYKCFENTEPDVQKAEMFVGNDYLKKVEPDVQRIHVRNCMDARRLVDSVKYEAACGELWKEIKKEIGSISDYNILVVGTEEFMFPALYVGRELEQEGNHVLCCSTTRSPIEVSMEEEYPLHSRYELKSLYDAERRTFIYDIAKYDKVFVITDAPNVKEGEKTLLKALGSENKDITVIRWNGLEKLKNF